MTQETTERCACGLDPDACIRSSGCRRPYHPDDPLPRHRPEESDDVLIRVRWLEAWECAPRDQRVVAAARQEIQALRARVTELEAHVAGVADDMRAAEDRGDSR